MGLFENFPYTNFHRLNLDWILKDWSSLKHSFNTLEEAFADLKNYVDSFFTDLDLQEEVNAKLDEMALDGSLDAILSRFLAPRSPIFERTVNSMYKCAMTYRDVDLVYGNATTAFDSTCLDGEIDCSTFCLLVLGGIDYNNSRYVLADNYYKSAGYGYNHFPDKTWAQIGTSRYSWNLAKSFVEKGWAFEPAADYSNIEAGDLLFFAFPESGGEEKWEGINHCAIALGRSQQSDPYPIIIADANVVEGTRQRVVQCSAIYSGYLANLKYIVRVPLEESGTTESVNYSINNASMNALAFPVAPGEMFSLKVKGHGRLRVFLNGSTRVLSTDFNGEYMFRGAYPSLAITSILVDCSQVPGGVIEALSLANGYTNHLEPAPLMLTSTTLAAIDTEIKNDLTAILPNLTSRKYRAKISDNPFSNTWAEIEAIRTQTGIAIFLKGAAGGAVIEQTRYVSP